MTSKKIFLSRWGFEDAAFKAKMAGYQVIGFGRNKQGYYVAFGRR